MSNFEKENDTEDMITCSNCGRCWDGNAQCCCYGIPIDEEEPEPKTRSHTMTLRSHEKYTSTMFTQKVYVGLKNKQQKESELKHPESWNKHSHYGQCGQSCPCCRAMVGDEWGACSICRKN